MVTGKRERERGSKCKYSHRGKKHIYCSILVPWYYKRTHQEGLENLPNLDKDFYKTNRTQSIVCFDDLVFAKNQKPIENYFIRSRRFNLS